MLPNHVQLIHILFVGPLLIYVGFMEPKYDWIYILLLLLGLFIFGKFLYMLVTNSLSQRYVWFLLHMLMFASLLMYVGIWRIMKKDVPHVAYSLLLALGIAAFGYHLIRWLGSLGDK
jgi:hypothetical protein